MKSVGDLAAFSVRQDAALSICDSRRAAVISILDAVATPKRKAWWRW